MLRLASPMQRLLMRVSQVLLTPFRAAAWAAPHAAAAPDRVLARAQPILDALSGCVAILDERGTILAVNQAWRDSTLAAAGGVGSPYLACPLGQVDAVAEGIRAVLAGERADLVVECPCDTPHGQRWFLLRATRAAGAHTRQFVVAHEDITALTRAQQALAAHADLEAQLLQAQKLEGIGQLASGIAHDFNNILAAITGYAELVESVLPARSEAHPDLREIRRASQRAATLTRQLLAFARQPVVVPRVTDLAALTLNLDAMLRRLIGEDIALVTRAAPDLHQARVDPGQIEQVIVNLVVNARAAMPDGGQITIALRNGRRADVPALAARPDAPDAYVVLTVTDTGCGMPPDVIRQACDPFFTTKPAGQGTGLGLALAYDILTRHGGAIAIASTVGVGTTITVALPAAMEADGPAERPRALPPAAHAAAGATILVVEDEPTVREMIARTLRRHGATVLEAADGGTALDVLAAHGDRIDLLITDVVLPHLGGRALADALTARAPDLRVLFMSGYPEAALVQPGRLDPSERYLQKPFRAATLLARVTEALAAAALPA